MAGIWADMIVRCGPWITAAEANSTFTSRGTRLNMGWMGSACDETNSAALTHTALAHIALKCRQRNGSYSPTDPNTRPILRVLVGYK